MCAASRQMHLGVFVLGTGNHSAGWRYDGAATSNLDLSVTQEIARIAERGKFDLLFISDGLTMDPGDHPSFLCRFEPTTLISVLAATTRHIGLGATVSTSFGEPYHVARTFASIDHISNGRAAWNVVTSTAAKAALNFSRERHMEHDLRYEVANEFVDVVKGLWDCWDDDAIVADKATGDYIDPARVRPLDHKGRFFQVKGPINIARCAAGPPGHHPGRRLAVGARTRGAHRPMSSFRSCRNWTAPRPPMPTSRAGSPNTAARPDQLAVLPGVMPIIGATDAEAKDKLSLLQSWLTPTNAAILVSGRIGYDVSGHPLDGPVPRAAAGRQQPDLFAGAVRSGTAREHDPARPLQPDRGGARPLGDLRHADGISPTFSKNGSSRVRPTGSTSCRPISPARSPILSIWSCRNCSAAASTAATTRGRPCATISASHACRRRGGHAAPSARTDARDVLDRQRLGGTR